MKIYDNRIIKQVVEITFLTCFFLIVFITYCYGTDVTDPADFYAIPSNWRRYSLQINWQGWEENNYEFDLLGRKYRTAIFMENGPIAIPARLNNDGTVSRIDDIEEFKAASMYTLMTFNYKFFSPMHRDWYYISTINKEAAEKCDPSQADPGIICIDLGKFFFGLGMAGLFPQSAPHSVSTLGAILTTLSTGSALINLCNDLNNAQAESNELMMAFRAHYLIDPDGFYDFVNKNNYERDVIRRYINRKVQDYLQIGMDGIQALGWITSTSDNNINAIGGTIDDILSGTISIGEGIHEINWYSKAHIAKNISGAFAISLVTYALVNAIGDIGVESKRVLMSLQYHHNVEAMLAKSIEEDLNSIGSISDPQETYSILVELLLKFDYFYKVEKERLWAFKERLERIKYSDWGGFIVVPENLYLGACDDYARALDDCSEVEVWIDMIPDNIDKALLIYSSPKEEPKEEVIPVETNLPPSFIFVSPITADNPADGDIYAIRWMDNDPDDNALIILYYAPLTEGDEYNPSEYNKDNLPPNWNEKKFIRLGPFYEDDEGYSGDSFFWVTSSDAPVEIPNGTYYIIAQVSDGHTEFYKFSPGTIKVEHPYESNNFIVFSDIAEDDNSDGDGNGIMENGEMADYKIIIKNVSGEIFYNVVGDLTTLTTGVTIIDDRVAYGNIDAGGTSSVLDDFNFDTLTGFTGMEDYRSADFNLKLQYEDENGKSYYENKSLSVRIWRIGEGVVDLFVKNIIIDDSGSYCNGDGIFQSGENIGLYVELSNKGNAPCINPRGTINQITTWGSNVLADRESRYPNITADGSATNQYDFDTYEAPYDFSGPLNMTMVVEYGPDNEFSQEVNFTIDVHPAPYISIYPKNYDFGIEQEGNIINKTIAINNYGSADLEISSVNASHSDTIVSGISLPLIIPHGSTVDCSIEFNTTGLTDDFYTRTITFNSNSFKDSTKSFTFSGYVTNTGADIFFAQGCGSSDDEYSLDIHKTNVIFSCGAYDIYVMDLITGTTTQITSNDGNYHLSPSIYDNYVTWVQMPAAGTTHECEIYLYDLNSDTTTRITNDELSDWEPKIRGDYIVWNKNMFKTSPVFCDIYLYKISTGETTHLTSTDTINEEYPRIYGDTVVWADDWGRIYKYIISSKQVSQIADAGYIEDLEVFGNNVFWIDDSPYDVYKYNGSIVNLTNNGDDKEEEEIAIYENIIVFRNNDNTLYKMGTDGGPVEVLSGNMWPKASIQLYDKTVIWRDNRDSKWDIYMKSLCQKDIAVNTNNINFNPDIVLEDEHVIISAIVQNLGNEDVNNVITQFYQGNPEEGGTQIGNNILIGTIVKGEERIVQVPWQVATEGSYIIHITFTTDDCESNYGNNEASKDISVADDDTNPPIISNINVEEYNGDGDGLIEDDEYVKFSWQAEDSSGISSNFCTIGDVDYNPNQDISGYYLIAGSYITGKYDFTIHALDSDNSPLSSEKSSFFISYVNAPKVISTYPNNGATGVPVNTKITATLNISLNPETLNTETILVKDSLLNNISGNVSYSNDLIQAIFQPNEELKNSENYTVTFISGSYGIKDENGNELQEDYIWSFITEEDVDDPIAIIDEPINGDKIHDIVTIKGTAWDKNFNDYQLFYGIGDNPSEWNQITSQIKTPVLNNLLGTWDTTEMNDGLYSIKLLVRDVIPALNMKTKLINVSVDNSKQIFYNSGWSMISLMVTPSSSLVSDLFPEAKVVYGYERSNGYVRVNGDKEIEVGKGYWILFDQNQTYTIKGQPIHSFKHILHDDGWHMIGGCTYPAHALVDGCDLGVIYGYVPGTGYKRVLESQDLEPGQGYWILLNNVMDQAELTVEAR